jgi:DNA-binding LacI/PurR family transcriptional regulator
MQVFSPFLQMYDGLNGAFHESDVTLRTEFLHMPNGGSLKSQLNQLLNYKTSGVVIDSNLRDDIADIAEHFESNDVPTIQIGHTVRAPNVDAVVVDNFTGAYNATRHLCKQGHRRIATIRWNVQGDPASSKKFAGFTCALADAGLAVRPEYVVESPYTKEPPGKLPGRVALGQLMSLPEPPTAIFVENSFISPSLLYPSDPSERELPRPLRELDIVHFEAWHLEWLEQVMAGKLGFPERKTKLMRINWEELGRVAAKRLLARTEGMERTGEVIQIVPRLFQVDGYNYMPLDIAG